MSISYLNMSVCWRILTPWLLKNGSCYVVVWCSRSRSVLVVCLTAQTRGSYIHRSNINSAFGSEVFSLHVQVVIPGSDHGSNKGTRTQTRKLWCYVHWGSNRVVWASQCGFLWTIGHRQLFRNRKAYIYIYIFIYTHIYDIIHITWRWGCMMDQDKYTANILIMICLLFSLRL